jgi:hypothetical protein
MPERPATILAHASCIVLPTGEMIPKPVITTRRIDKANLGKSEVNDQLLWLFT